MLSKHIETGRQVLIFLLIVAVALGYNPWPSSVALFVFLSYRIADRYFHDSFHDENKATLTRLSTDVTKLKESQNRTDMKAVFGGTK